MFLPNSETETKHRIPTSCLPYLTPWLFQVFEAKHNMWLNVTTALSQRRLHACIIDHLIVSHMPVEPTKLKHTNIFEVPKVPKKGVVEEPVPVTVPKKPEPAPVRGTCYRVHQPVWDCFLLSCTLFVMSVTLFTCDCLKFWHCAVYQEWIPFLSVFYK